jgi:hypothetical protein
MNRKTAWLITPLLLACIHLTEAQQPAKILKIGYLSAVSDSPASQGGRQAVRRELERLGYIEGKNIVFESRYADNKLDRLLAWPMSWSVSTLTYLSLPRRMLP